MLFIDLKPTLTTPKTFSQE